MVIVPLILTSIIIGISSINDRAKIGRMGLKTLIYYISTSLIAILIGLSLIAAAIYFKDTAVKPAYAYGNPATKSDVKNAINDCLHRARISGGELSTRC